MLRINMIHAGLLAALKAWKNSTLFSGPENWLFASAFQAGNLPWSYDQVWRKYQAAAKTARIGRLGTHALLIPTERGLTLSARRLEYNRG